MEEKWKTLWWNTRYEVSNMGRIRNKRTNKMLTANPTKSHRRPQVWLWSDYFDTTLQYTLARLVYYTFNPTDGHTADAPCVYHRDGNVMNCRLDNLYIK